MLTDSVSKKWKFKVVTNAHATRARIPPGLAGKIEKFCPLPEPIRLQVSQNLARLRTEKKIEFITQSLQIIYGPMSVLPLPLYTTTTTTTPIFLFRIFAQNGVFVE